MRGALYCFSDDTTVGKYGGASGKCFIFGRGHCTLGGGLRSEALYETGLLKLDRVKHIMNSNFACLRDSNGDVIPPCQSFVAFAMACQLFWPTVHVLPPAQLRTLHVISTLLTTVVSHAHVKTIDFTELLIKLQPSS